MASLIHHVAHGFVGGEAVYFGNLFPDDCGLIEGDTYYVLAAGITADDFSVSETDGGTPFDLTFDIEEGIVSLLGTYEAITDTGDVNPPPLAIPATPSAPSPTSALVSGLVRLTIGVADITSDSIRSIEVQATHSFSGADADWTKANVFTLPHGQVQVTVPCIGSTVYATRRRVHDVFGGTSLWSAEANITTEAGDEVLQAAIASVANDIPDGLITGVKIGDNSIEARHMTANSISANALAATIILTSLLATGEAGERRVEIDDQGIRLIAADESPVVTISTDPLVPVYVAGRIDASALVTNESAEFRLVASLASSAVMTLQNGIAAPSGTPSIVASVDYLPLTSTPSGISTAAGIGYDSGAGTFWLACDPTVSPYYVAIEYNATTGAVVRHISATGGTTTTTTTLGSTSHVTDTADGLAGSTNSHITTPLTMPRDGRITRVSAYFAGRSGSCSARVGVWNTSNIALRESATFTASSGGATTLGASDHYDKALSSELNVTSGTTYRVGFRHTDSSEGFQFDKDDGAGKTTYSGDGTGDDGTGWGTYDSAGKPNVYITYEYDTDTRLETAPNIGVATDGTHVYTLDNTGVVWKYLRSTLAYVSKSSVQTAITGTKSKAGLFYDATATELIITTSTGTGAGVYPKFVRVNPSTLAVATAVYSAAAGTTFSGTTDTFRGGARLVDPLNGSAATYWVATTSAVYAYTYATTVATQTANRNFGQSTTTGDGLTHDGTQFRGWDSASPTKVWKFSNWDFTTASTTLWVGYAWYDSVVTTHETVMGPRSSLTIRRRERVQVTTPAVPTGGTDDPDHCRVYALQSGSDTGAGTFWLQNSGEAVSVTSRYLTDCLSSGTADFVTTGGGRTAFAAGTPATLTGAASGAWSLKGDGTLALPTTATPVTADARAYWDTTKTVRIHDGTRIKPVTPIGYLPYAWPLGFNNEATFSATRALTAVVAGSGQAVAIPFMLHAPMLLESYTLWSVDTASLRTCEMRLYYDDGTANAVFVTGSDATLSFTPTVASARTATVSAAPVILAPGVYWHVIRNTSTTQTFGIATAANTSPGAIAASVRVGTTTSLAGTLDIISVLSGASNGAHAMKLQGRVFGRSVADF